jgi:O-antigen ligase
LAAGSVMGTLPSILATLLFAVVAAAPLPLGANRPFGWSALALLIGGVLVGWGAMILRRPDLLSVPFRRYRTAILGFGLLAAWIFAQSFILPPGFPHHPIWDGAGDFAAPTPASSGAISMAPAETLTGLMRIVCYGAIVFLGLHLGRERLNAERGLWILGLAAFAYSFYGLLVFFAGIDMVGFYPKILYLDSVTGPFVNRNSFATYAGLGLLVILALLFGEIDRARPIEGAAGRPAPGYLGSTRFWVLVVMAIVIAAALALSRSRGGFASSLIGLITLFVIAGARPGQRFRPIAIGLPLVIILISAFLLSGGLMHRMVSEDSETTRRLIYTDTLRAIADHPLLGTGLGSFADAFSPYREPALLDTDGTITMAHNTYLELALELGVPAFVSYMLILAALAWACARGSFVRRRDWIYPALAVAASVLVALHSLVDFSLQMPAIAATYALILSLGFAQSWARRAPHFAPVATVS